MCFCRKSPDVYVFIWNILTRFNYHHCIYYVLVHCMVACLISFCHFVFIYPALQRFLLTNIYANVYLSHCQTVTLYILIKAILKAAEMSLSDLLTNLSTSIFKALCEQPWYVPYYMDTVATLPLMVALITVAPCIRALISFTFDHVFLGRTQLQPPMGWSSLTLFSQLSLRLKWPCLIELVSRHICISNKRVNKTWYATAGISKSLFPWHPWIKISISTCKTSSVIQFPATYFLVSLIPA